MRSKIGVAVFFLSFCFSSLATASPMKVMTFNVMCDFCDGKKEYGTFKERIPFIADTINRHEPDLVSLQEIRSRIQLKKILRKLKIKYRAVYSQGMFLSYPDATLLVRTDRFSVTEEWGGFLGKNWPSFSFGWAAAFPRRLQFAKILDHWNGTHFIFAGTHFDNNRKNKEPSAELAVKLFAEETLPILFAGDMNLNPTSPGYTVLSSSLRDSFSEAGNPIFFSNSGTIHPNEACMDAVTQVFPACRIDHLFLSKNAPWKIRSWGVDLYRYRTGRSFTSDHRAVIVELGF